MIPRPALKALIKRMQKSYQRSKAAGKMAGRHQRQGMKETGKALEHASRTMNIPTPRRTKKGVIDQRVKDKKTWGDAFKFVQKYDPDARKGAFDKYKGMSEKFKKKGDVIKGGLRRRGYK